MRVNVLGCGYLGIALGRRLREAGVEVVGVRRSDAGLEAVEAAGLRPARGDITDRSSLEGLPTADWVVIAASPDGRDPADARRLYVEGTSTAIRSFGVMERPPDRVVYTSSTGVYGDHDGGWVDETTPLEPATARGRALVEAERAARATADEVGVDWTIARLAGLYGPGRYRLTRYLDGPVTEGYLNLIHRDDAAGAIAYLLERDLARDRVVLVVDDEPVARGTLAQWLADAMGRPPPETIPVHERLARESMPDARAARIAASKRCSNGRLRGLGYGFRYPTYREGYREAVEAADDRQ